MRRFVRQVRQASSDESFVRLLQGVESLAAKILSIGMAIVILVSVADLCIFLFQELATEPYGFFSSTLLEIFGLFLNVLVALEILENITAYLKKHIIQVELVIATALTAVGRKIIIFDFKSSTGLDLVGLGVAVVALAVGYWLVRRSNRYHPDVH